MYIFTHDSFKSWLESKPPRSIVGRCGISHSCPAAKWLNEVNNSRFEVDIRIMNGYRPFVQYFDIPEWLIIFIRQLDSKKDFRLVQARTCLEILEKQADAMLKERTNVV